ncbi:uncharacterized protein ARMOST_13311 [Armillaria ostoyae]|uniref:Uncharacterized protein n=1 Tax=Armillaria ostoyae TaxID=47428 RepID=A0A284RME1_ARMOS|nr:uncharacterized protein ARMOST_13311 [Armillaria ostoyae]
MVHAECQRLANADVPEDSPFPPCAESDDTFGSTCPRGGPSAPSPQAKKRINFPVFSHHASTLSPEFTLMTTFISIQGFAGSCPGLAFCSFLSSSLHRVFPAQASDDKDPPTVPSKIASCESTRRTTRGIMSTPMYIVEPFVIGPSTGFDSILTRMPGHWTS